MTLHDAPDAAKCEEIAIRLRGAAQHVLQFREGLMQEHGLNGQ